MQVEILNIGLIKAEEMTSAVIYVHLIIVPNFSIGDFSLDSLRNI